VARLTLCLELPGLVVVHLKRLKCGSLKNGNFNRFQQPSALLQAVLTSLMIPFQAPGHTFGLNFGNICVPSFASYDRSGATIICVRESATVWPWLHVVQVHSLILMVGLPPFFSEGLLLIGTMPYSDLLA